MSTLQTALLAAAAEVVLGATKRRMVLMAAAGVLVQNKTLLPDHLAVAVVLTATVTRAALAVR
jgi:hypothetical protein